MDPWNPYTATTPLQAECVQVIDTESKNNPLQVQELVIATNTARLRCKQAPDKASKSYYITALEPLIETCKAQLQPPMLFRNYMGYLDEPHFERAMNVLLDYDWDHDSSTDDVRAHYFGKLLQYYFLTLQTEDLKNRNRLLSRLIRKYPEDLYLLKESAASLAFQNRPDNALDVIQQALEISAKLGIDPDVELYFFKASTLRALDLLDEALETFVTFLERAPEDDRNLANGYYGAAQVAMNLHRTSKAKKFFSKGKKAEERNMRRYGPIKTPVKMLVSQGLNAVGKRTEDVGNCRKCEKVSKPKLCAKCQEIIYCSRECQKSDWKRHKKECASLANARKENIRSQNENDKNLRKQTRKTNKETPVDLYHNGDDVWNEAIRFASKKEFEKAAERYCYGLFLEFDRDVRLFTEHGALTTMQHVNESDPYGILLKLIGDKERGKFHPHRYVEAQNRLKVIALNGSVDAAYMEFALGLFHVFFARQLGRGAAVNMNGGNHSFSQLAVDEIRLAKTFIEPTRYITLMFDLAYTNRDICAKSQARYWYKRILKFIPRDHWMHSKCTQSLWLLDMMPKNPNILSFMT